MTDSVFDVALEKRFADSQVMTSIDVTSDDTLLIRNSETGVVMRIPFLTMTTAISEAFASSFASLVDGKVPSSQLPSYVDDVLEYANIAAFPGTGETGKIYVAQDTNRTYRWSGSLYVEISPSPGSTDSVTEGSVNLYFTNGRASAAAPVQSVAGKTGTVTLAKTDVGLSNVDNTSDANKPVSTAQQAALDLKSPKTNPVFDGILTVDNSVVDGGSFTVATGATKTVTISGLAYGTIDANFGGYAPAGAGYMHRHLSIGGHMTTAAFYNVATISSASSASIVLGAVTKNNGNVTFTIQNTSAQTLTVIWSLLHCSASPITVSAA